MHGVTGGKFRVVIEPGYEGQPPAPDGEARDVANKPRSKGIFMGARGMNDNLQRFPCCKIDVEGVAWVSQQPVLLYQWAEFIRQGAYFDAAFWTENSRRRQNMLGDRLLEEVGFCWDKRRDPVTNIDWYEAAAYCRWQQGRLPFSTELKELQKWDEHQRTTPRKSFFWSNWRDQHAPNPPAEPHRCPSSEWCNEYWNSSFIGRSAIYPAGTHARRLWGGIGGSLDRMIPTERTPRVGFRVVFKQNPDSRY